MSGICMIVGARGAASPDASEAEAMAAPLVRKDAMGVRIGAIKAAASDGVAVAVYDQFGDDPNRFLCDGPDLLVVCDAEIYNWEALKGGKAPERGWSEAALIADLYRKRGHDWWREIRGVYAAFIWDKRDRKGSAYRDRLGVKALVYHESGGRVLAASSIACISSRPGFRKDLDNQALYSYLEMEMIPTPFTIYRGIHKLEGGYRLEAGDGRVATHRLWDMDYPAEKLTDPEEIKKLTRDLLKDAVGLQSGYRAGIGQVGAFLSGGTDSSSIAGMMDSLHPGQVQTYSIGFDESGYDEMHYARIAAKAFHTKHSEYYVTADDVLRALPLIVSAYDEPFANSSVIPTYFCARLARERGVTTLLGGDGGDEIFGGNERYYSTFAHFSRYPRWFVDGIAPLVLACPEWARVSLVRKVFNYVKRSRAPLHDKIHGFSLSYYFDVGSIFSKQFLAERKYLRPEDIARGYLERVSDKDPLDQYLYYDLKTTIMDNDLRKVVGMTELADINVRFPFLDPALVEFTGRIPPGLKVKGPHLRYIFKEALKGFLPDEIIQKQKHGFGLPVVRWMMRPGPLNDLLKDTLLSGDLKVRGVFHPDFVATLYKRSQDDATPFYGTYLFYILFLELWLREHLSA